MKRILSIILLFVLVVTLVAYPAGTSARADSVDRIVTFPDDAHMDACRLIESATTSILFTIYDFSDPRIEDYLADAAARGVAVKVMVDPGERLALTDSKGIVADLVRAGIAVRSSNPSYRITHAKYFVVDGTSAYISGNNFTYADGKKNRAFAIVTTDAKVISDLTTIFWSDWQRKPVTLDQLTSDRLIVSPLNAGARIKAMIDGAKTSIVVATQYLENDMVNQALAAAAARGVKVQAITDGTYADARAAASAAVTLIGSGTVRVSMTPYYHVKMMIIDGTQMFVGSQNYSDPPLKDGNPLIQQREIGIVVTDPALIARAQAVFAFDWARSQQP
ncbi:MAG: phospholipase D-like domain-containing protein [Candidatus Cryosericum sp.]